MSIADVGATECTEANVLGGDCGQMLGVHKRCLLLYSDRGQFLLVIRTITLVHNAPSDAQSPPTFLELISVARGE